MSIQEFSPIQPVALRAETTQEDKAATKIQAAWRGLSIHFKSFNIFL